jgi:hypothetical protein
MRLFLSALPNGMQYIGCATPSVRQTSASSPVWTSRTPAPFAPYPTRGGCTRAQGLLRVSHGDNDCRKQPAIA